MSGHSCSCGRGTQDSETQSAGGCSSHHAGEGKGGGCGGSCSTGGHTTKTQTYHLILADIAMAAAIEVCAPGTAVTVREEDYHPGALRDLWYDATTDPLVRRRVTALAKAGEASLQASEGAQLLEMASRYGVPLPSLMAGDLEEHFTRKREAILTYRR